MAFDVTAVLKANVSNFTSGMKEAQSVFESFQSKSNRTFEGIADGLGKAGTALTAGLTAPTIAGVGAIIKSYGDLEQAVGGVRTLFVNELGDASQTVIDNANKAFQTAGVSATQYMEQVSSFSATLLQGLGGDTAKAAAYGDKAIIQMADNANKMGTSIESIQMAYQGFAKDNYTMLDNLKLGYGGTQSEMARLVNESGVLNGAFEATAENVKDIPFSTLIDAIGIVQDRLGITGATSQEASETVSGSFQAMKAAGMNLVAGLGDNEANIKVLMENLAGTIGNFSKNIKRVLKNIWNNLPMAEWQKWVALIAVGAGPVLLALSGIMEAVETLKSVFQGIGAVLTNPWGLAIVAIAALVAGLVYAYQHSEKFRNIVNSAVSAVVAKFNELKAQVQPALDVIKQALSKMNVGAFAPLIGGIGLTLVALNKLKAFKIPNPFSKFKFTFPKIPNPFTGLANMAKSAGTAVKNVFSGLGKGIASIFKGIGTAVATVFKGIASAISMLSPQGVLAFAIGLAAVTAALVALSAVQGMVLPFLSGLADIFVKLVGGVLQGFASALVTLAPVMTTIAQALAMLSPLVVAFGMAFSMVATAIGGAVSSILTALTPIIAILSTTFVQIVSIIATAVVSIVQALAPFIPSITEMFTSIVQIIGDTIVQIVQALAPFIPSITTMVVQLVPLVSQIISAFNNLVNTIGPLISQIISAVNNLVNQLAPIISQFIDAFTNLVNQIGPIIDSISNLFETLGEQISSILESAGSVVESFGSAIRNVLDGVAGIFESMGNAAKNAGMGVKLMAQGIKMLVDLSLGDLVGTLGAVATGLGAIAGSGIAQAGPGLQAAGTGLQLMATSAQMASVAIQTLPTALSTLSSGLGTLPGMLITAGAGITVFAQGAQVSATSLLSIGNSITQFAALLMTVGPSASAAGAGLASFNAQASFAGNAMRNLGTASTSALTMVRALGTGIMTSMIGASTAINSACLQMSTSVRNAGSQMTTALRQAGTQMVTISQATMNQMKSIFSNGMSSIASTVRNNGSQMVSAWRSVGQQMVSTTQNFVNTTNSTLRNIGSGVNLYSNGNALMAGLKSGIDAGWSQITASVSSMAKWIKDHKGPVSYDKRLLVENGRAIMYGLDRGISAGWELVKDNVSSMAGQLSELVRTGLDSSFDLPTVATNLMTDSVISHTPQTVQHSVDNVASQQRLIKKVDEVIEEIRKNGNTYLDGKIISRKVDHNLGQNTQLRSRTSWV